MIVGAPTQQYQVGNWHWQIYEVSGPRRRADRDRSARSRRSRPTTTTSRRSTPPTAASCSRRTGRAAARPTSIPQRDEYESAPIVAGIYALDEQAGTFELLEHSPSGVDVAVARQLRARDLHQVGPPAARPAGRRARRRPPPTRPSRTRAKRPTRAKTTSLAGAEVFPEPRTAERPGVLAGAVAAHVQPVLPVGDQRGRHGRRDAQPHRPPRARRRLHRGKLPRRPEPDLLHTRQPAREHSSGSAATAASSICARIPPQPGDFLATYAPEFGTGVRRHADAPDRRARDQSRSDGADRRDADQQRRRRSRTRPATSAIRCR